MNRLRRIVEICILSDSLRQVLALTALNPIYTNRCSRSPSDYGHGAPFLNQPQTAGILSA